MNRVRVLANLSPREWTEELLGSLTHYELRALAILAVFPSYRSKSAQIERLLALGQLRVARAPSMGIDALVQGYRRQDLHAWAKAAKLWCSGTKRQPTTVLLNWRNACRTRGQEA